jgi:hypothetical protein
MKNMRESVFPIRRGRDVGAAGRPFKLIVKERIFSMRLVYYFRLYIALSGFLFNFDYSNVCRDMHL